MLTWIVRLAIVLIATSRLSGVAPISVLPTFEAPVTLSLKISYTGPDSERIIGTDTVHQAKLVSYKYTNKEFIQGLVNHGVISSASGWKLIARWNAGAHIAEYQFYLVKKGEPDVAVADVNGFAIDTGVMAAGYNERWRDDMPVSGSGNIVFGASCWLGALQFKGVGTGGYAIKPPLKGYDPVVIFSGINLNLFGGIISDNGEALGEMTLIIGKPTIPTSDYDNVGGVARSGGLTVITSSDNLSVVALSN